MCLSISKVHWSLLKVKRVGDKNKSDSNVIPRCKEMTLRRYKHAQPHSEITG